MTLSGLTSLSKFNVPSDRGEAAPHSGGTYGRTGFSSAEPSQFDLTEDLMRLKHELAEVRNSLDASERIRGGLAVKNLDLTSALAAAESERDSVSYELRRARAVEEEARRERVELRIRVEMLQAEQERAQGYRKRCEELWSECEALRKERDRLASGLAAATGEGFEGIVGEHHHQQQLKSIEECTTAGRRPPGIGLFRRSASNPGKKAAFAGGKNGRNKLWSSLTNIGGGGGGSRTTSAAEPLEDAMRKALGAEYGASDEKKRRWPAATETGDAKAPQSGVSSDDDPAFMGWGDNDSDCADDAAAARDGRGRREEEQVQVHPPPSEMPEDPPASRGACGDAAAGGDAAALRRADGLERYRPAAVDDEYGDDGGCRVHRPCEMTREPPTSLRAVAAAAAAALPLVDDRSERVENLCDAPAPPRTEEPAYHARRRRSENRLDMMMSSHTYNTQRDVEAFLGELWGGDECELVSEYDDGEDFLDNGGGSILDVSPPRNSFTATEA